MLLNEYEICLEKFEIWAMFVVRGPHIVMSRTDAPNGLDFHLGILIVTKYQAQIQMESYKLVSLTYKDPSLSLSEEAFRNRFSVRTELEGRRRRLLNQTTRKQTKTIQTTIHTGRTIISNRGDFPLSAVIVVDTLAERVVMM